MEQTEYDEVKKPAASGTATPESTTRVSDALAAAKSNQCKRLYPGSWSPWREVPDKTRSWDGVPFSVKATLHDLIVGNLPWPLLITGEVGSGKTCVGLCLSDSFGGWYTSVGDLHEKVLAIRDKRLFWTGPTGCQVTLVEFWKLWKACSLCVLDELGTRTPTDAAYETIKLAIDGREERPFVAISNLPPSGLAEVCDNRIASRLASGTVLEMRGDKRL